MNEIKLSGIDEEVDNIIDPMVELFLPQYAAQVSFAHAALKIPSAIHDYRLYQKFGRFLNSLHGNISDSVNFSSQLFSDEKTARENGYRLVQYIDRAETLTTIDYMVNASRSAGNQLITKDEYYRILWALTNTFPEDLHYFRSIAVKDSLIPGNTQIIALAQNGLMILAGTDANKSVESQDYVVTEFGVKVDRYALSLDDEERWNEWKRREGVKKEKMFKASKTEIKWDEKNGGTLLFK